MPEGTLGSRGTEFQTNVTKNQTSTLLIGPGQNNTLGLRPGAVLVGNKFGKTMLDNPYSMTSMTKGKAPGKAKTKQRSKKSEDFIKQFSEEFAKLKEQEEQHKRDVAAMEAFLTQPSPPKPEPEPEPE